MKKGVKSKKSDQENVSDASRTPHKITATDHSITSTKNTFSPEKYAQNKTKARMIIAKNQEGLQKFGAMMGKAK